jgi:hypothetical protein
MNNALGLVICWLLATLAAPCPASAAAEPEGAAIVETVDGRQLSGRIDERSDQRALWLRREEPGVVLASAVAWTDVCSAAVDGATLSPDELKARRAELATAAAPPNIEGLAAEAVAPMPSATIFMRPRARVRRVEILGADLVNLDRDVEPDGFRIAIAAVDEQGSPVAVRGTLRAFAYGERRPLLEPEVKYDEIGRWTQRVRPEDFVDGVAVYELRLRRTAPEWEFDLLPDALLTIELGAAGHGNFAASTPIILRKFNPLRDSLQQHQGRRFLPAELQGTRPLNPFGPQDGRWQFWAR